LNALKKTKNIAHGTFEIIYKKVFRVLRDLTRASPRESCKEQESSQLTVFFNHIANNARKVDFLEFALKRFGDISTGII
jgi:hypothetical protein